MERRNVLKVIAVAPLATQSVLELLESQESDPYEEYLRILKEDRDWWRNQMRAFIQDTINQELQLFEGGTKCNVEMC